MPELPYLESVVKTMRANSRTPVLCIDEFEGLINEGAFDLRFFTGLRAIAQAGLVLIVASKRPLIDLVSGKLQTSPFFNIFERLTLGPFSAKEAETFVRTKSLQAHFNDEEQSRLLLHGQLDKRQWPPVRLQIVGTLLLEDKILAEREGPGLYCSGDTDYWRGFEERVEETYREVVG